MGRIAGGVANPTQFLEVPPPGDTLFVLGDLVYVHWAIANDSRLAVADPFQVGIAIDGVVKITFPVAGLGSGDTARELNIALSIEDAGQHELALIVDVDGRVNESDESDNTFAVRPMWVAAALTPTPTAASQASGITFRWTYQPDGSTNLTSGVSTGVTSLRAEQGFIFAAQTVTDPSADIYYLDSSCAGCSGISGPGFWANNGAGGVHDLGSIDFGDVATAPASEAGPFKYYDSQETPAIAGHVYVIRTKDGAHYAKLIVTSVAGAAVTPTPTRTPTVTPTSTPTPTTAPATPTATPASGEIVDQQQTSRRTTSTLTLGGDKQQIAAQVVTVGVTGSLIEIRVALGGKLGTVVVDIQGVTNGLPNGTILNSHTVAVASIPAECCFAPFESVQFSSPASFIAGDQFAIVLKSIGENATVRGPVGATYSGGGAFFDARPNPPGWLPFQDGSAMAFQTIMLPGPGPTPTATATAAPPTPTATPQPAASTGGWSDVGTLITHRYLHTATLLASGDVLLTGGWNSSQSPTANSERFDPSTGATTATGDMNAARYFHTGTLLPNGKVLIVGGHDSGRPLAKTELYDRSTGVFNYVSELVKGRYYHTATLLPNGTVLVTGGVDAFGEALREAELYDPVADTFAVTGSMRDQRRLHTATLLPNGKVLVTGGLGPAGGNRSSAEVFDPATETWNPTGNMAKGRYSHAATLLSNGNVLIVGSTDTNDPDSIAEVYDPSSGTFFTVGGLAAERYDHTATLLGDGTVLVVAGIIAGGDSTTTEIFDPSAGGFSHGESLQVSRYLHTATMLPNGDVLVAGGYGPGVVGQMESYTSH
ncbi:MAG: kelch repeat-containing protein [SAR202 cluster bacterium]|nr:kelch repeat-containing protein [SAR202 cluster bacterium]